MHKKAIIKLLFGGGEQVCVTIYKVHLSIQKKQVIFKLIYIVLCLNMLCEGQWSHFELNSVEV